MKTLNELLSNVTSLVDSHVKSYHSSSLDLQNCFTTWLDSHMLTDSGNRRYPLYYNTALRAVFDQMVDLYTRQNCIFCYLVDDVLYTTYNKNNHNKYYFIGNTDIESYRLNPEIERRILARDFISSGLYYSNGKCYYSHINKD